MTLRGGNDPRGCMNYCRRAKKFRKHRVLVQKWARSNRAHERISLFESIPGRRSESTGKGKSLRASLATGSEVSTLMDEVGHASIARYAPRLSSWERVGTQNERRGTFYQLTLATTTVG